MPGTVMPQPVFTGWDNNGDRLSGGLLYTYAAGTTTPLATYTDVALAVANANPIVLDSAGRAVVYLTPASYKFVLKTSAGVTVWTQDNISAIPGTNVDQDVAGTAGEALAAGDVAYLSRGDGGKTPGQWYLADADFPYASTEAALIGMVQAAVLSGAAGSFRLLGRLTGLSGLTAGATYYVSATAGDLTATAPALARAVGVADTTTTLILAPNPASALGNPAICQGRLTATTAVPVTTADVSAATSIYYTPYTGNLIALYDGTAAWNTRTFSEITISLAGLTASKPDDIFAYDNAGVVTIETLVWTNATTRATALTTQNGVLVKSGATTRRYLGTVYINASGGQTDDSAAKRYISNYYNRAERSLRVLEATNTWTYTTATLRQANASAANQLDVMIGWADVLLEAQVLAIVSNDTATDVNLVVGIGEDSTTTQHTSVVGRFQHATTLDRIQQVTAALRTFPAVGRHFYAWLEYSSAAGTTTWYGDNGGLLIQSGIFGSIKN